MEVPASSVAMSSITHCSYPHINSMARRDPEQAANTRRAVLTDCPQHDRLLMPVHFAGSSCGHVRHDKDVYAWEELS
jgi:hypothetical protein